MTSVLSKVEHRQKESMISKVKDRLRNFIETFIDNI